MYKNLTWFTEPSQCYNYKCHSLPSRSLIAELSCSSLDVFWISKIGASEKAGFESGSDPPFLSHLSLAGLWSFALELVAWTFVLLTWLFLPLFLAGLLGFLLELLDKEELFFDETTLAGDVFDEDTVTDDPTDPALVCTGLGAEQWQVENPLKKHTEHWMARKFQKTLIKIQK